MCKSFSLVKFTGTSEEPAVPILRIGFLYLENRGRRFLQNKMSVNFYQTAVYHIPKAFFTLIITLREDAYSTDVDGSILSSVTKHLYPTYFLHI